MSKAGTAWQDIEAKRPTPAYGRIASLTSCIAQATASPLGAAQVMLCPLTKGAAQPYQYARQSRYSSSVLA